MSSYDHFFPEHAPPPPQEPEPDGDLHRLRSGYRRLRRVATYTALGYFVLFLVLSGYAPELMTEQITGGLTTGLLLGLLTLPVSLAAIALYERIARRRVDPLAAAIRHRAEQSAQATHTAQAPASRHGRTAAAPAAWEWTTGGTRA
ncbi:DUF485 domain-containing protein [Streptomyces sp. NPDC000410]|uniref:DUF485 domain-containing protein n=1 Tax=Streptomyces sp. NPDC000410 TaxID=3154254 RepID=UPI0033237B41